MSTVTAPAEAVEEAAKKGGRFWGGIKKVGGKAKAFAGKHKAALIAAGLGAGGLAAGTALGRYGIPKQRQPKD